MKRVIIDECLPRRLRTILPEHDVVTVPEAGFAGLKNGKLLKEISGNFDVFLTIDANLEYQQNLSSIDFGIVVIHSKTNRLSDIEPFSDEISAAVSEIEAGQICDVPRNSI